MNRWMIGAAAVAALATPAWAQESAGQLPDPNDQRDSFTIGAGAAWIPDYEGSNDYRIIPAAAVRGRVSGINFVSRGTYLYADLIRRGGGVDFDLGPIIGARLNRTGKIKDDFVAALPDRKTAIEVGGFAGVSFHGLTNPYDTLSFRVDLTKDIAGAHKSTLVSPAVEFGTPLSRTLYASVSASADWAGDGYADYYYSISPTDSAASLLPVYDANGGFKSWKLGLLVNQSITGDLTHGLSLFGTVNYGRLAGDFKRSPIVDLRGSATQKLAAIGLAYSF